MTETDDPVIAALAGHLPLECLSSSQQDTFFERLDEQFDNPPGDTVAYFAAMLQAGGIVGDDEHGNLVRSLPGGRIEPIG